MKANERDELVYEVIERRLEQQIDSVKNLDTKASITLAVVGVLLSGMIQMLSTLRLMQPYKGIALAAIITLIAAGVCGVLVFVQVRAGSRNVMDWRNDPDPGKLLAVKDHYNEAMLREVLCYAMEQSYDHNRTLYKIRYRYLYFSWVFIGITAILLVVTLGGGI